MKPAALESRKLQATIGIEKIVDHLLVEAGVKFEQPHTPVRKPAVKSLIALERIEAKLKMFAEATGLVLAVPDPTATVKAEQAEQAEETQTEQESAEGSEEAEQGEETDAGEAEQAEQAEE